VSGRGRSVEVSRSRGFFKAVFIAMGSPCELLIEMEDEAGAVDVGDAIAAEAWRIEEKFSRYLPGNIVARINDGERVDVDDETANLLDFAQTLYELSDRRFDITSGVLREAWTFDGSDNVPSQTEIDLALRRVGWGKVSWERPTLALEPGMQIDFGGIAKEYAVDKAAALADAQSGGAACLVNFGGDLAATRPPAGTNGWQVGIDSLDQHQGVAQKLIRLKNGGLATSGDSRRFLLKDGIRYGHILDPLSGWPIVDAPRSITVAADTCTQAGMLATLAMLRGAGAERFLDDQDVRHWCYR
jgi:thiamine biosynthesis lipoprotein